MSSADPTYVAELETQVRLLGDRIIKVNEENEQKQKKISELLHRAGRNPQIEVALTEKVQEAHKLKRELDAASKRLRSAERIVTTLQGELEAKHGLLERYYAEAGLSERLAAAEPLLTNLLEAVREAAASLSSPP